MAYKIVDLSQEIFEGMVVSPGQQKTFILQNKTYEQSKQETGSNSLGFASRNLIMSENVATNTSGSKRTDPNGKFLDKIDINHFIGSAICLDVSRVRYPDYIEVRDLEEALDKSGQELKNGDIVLLYTGHYDRTKGTDNYVNECSGLSYDGASYLGQKGVINIGIDTPSISLRPDDLDFAAHRAAQKYNLAYTTNLANLDEVINKRFMYVGLPLKIKDSLGSPVRAAALIGD